MSNLASSTGDDFPAAATKHYEDATLLLSEERWDNAAYLAGYVVECTMKTLIQLEHGEHRGHDLDQLSRKAQQLAALPGARTARYADFSSSSHPIYDYSVSGWSETLRYRPEGTVSEEDARSWINEAGTVYERVVIALRLDGVLTL